MGPEDLEDQVDLANEGQKPNVSNLAGHKSHQSNPDVSCARRRDSDKNNKRKVTHGEQKGQQRKATFLLTCDSLFHEEDLW